MQMIARPRCLLLEANASNCGQEMEAAVVVCFSPDVHEPELWYQAWATEAVGAGDVVKERLLPFCTMGAAKRALRNSPSAHKEDEYYTHNPKSGACFRLKRKKATQLMPEGAVEDILMRRILYRAAKKLHPPSFSKWADAVGGIDQNKFPILEKSKHYMKLKVSTKAEELNARATLVKSLEQFFKLQGAVVTKEFVSAEGSGGEGDEEGTDPIPDAEKISAGTVAARKRAFLEAAPADEKDALKQLGEAVRKRRKLSETQKVAIERLELEKVYGPPTSKGVDGTDQQRYALNERSMSHLCRSSVKKTFLLQCQLTPEPSGGGGEEPSFGERIAALARQVHHQDPTAPQPCPRGLWDTLSTEEVLDCAKDPHVLAMAGRDLLASVGMLPLSLTPEGLHAVTRDGLPKISGETIDLLEKLHHYLGTRRMKVDKSNALAKLVQAVKDCLGLRLYNPRDRGGYFRGERESVAALKFDPSLPRPSRELHAANIAWQDAKRFAQLAGARLARQQTK
jgi:hypothetical protein